jgi:hypothetical protein
VSAGVSPAQIERAQLLLEHERAAGPSDDAGAAGRVYEKLHANLAVLLGSAGVQALLVRSVKLTQKQYPFLERVDSATALRACLQMQSAAVAAESAAALFGTFFALITTFIGERLTSQVLRHAWPTIEGIPRSATAETTK